MKVLPWLSMSIWLPFFSGFFIFMFGSEKNRHWMCYMVLLFSFFSLLVGFPLIFNFNFEQIGLQFVEKCHWIPYLRIPYHIGIDGISIWLVLLTSFMTCLVILASWRSSKEYICQYQAAFLMLSGLMVGAFTSANAILFYIFFEATLIPIYLIIGTWGGKCRVYASFKFFLYTLCTSLLMLIALLYLRRYTGTSEIGLWHQLHLKMSHQIPVFLAFFVAFAVKVPMWPFHTWLPDAHVEAPTEGSMILASIMLKLGGYGFLRFSLPITPDAANFFSFLMVGLSIIAITYMALIALVQTNIKKIVAYSSIAHMGFVTLGLFIFDSLGIQGALVQMISHGFISAALFFCVGILYERTHTMEINAYGGVANSMPIFSVFFMFFAMANIALPGTSGFVGEMMVILAVTKFNFWVALLVSTTLVLSAAYTLRMYRCIFFGKANNSNPNLLKDINLREIFILLTLALPILIIGVYPRPFAQFFNGCTMTLFENIRLSNRF